MLSSSLSGSSGHVLTALGYTLVMDKLILTLWFVVASQHYIGFVTVHVTKFSELHLNNCLTLTFFLSYFVEILYQVCWLCIAL